MRCTRCHRPLRQPTESGMGPVCAKLSAPPVAPHERDLFGYNVRAAAEAAVSRLTIQATAASVDAVIQVRRNFAEARRRLGIWK